MVAHCSTRATVVPYAISIMSKHPLWLDHNAFGAESLKCCGKSGGPRKKTSLPSLQAAPISRSAYARALDLLKIGWGAKMP
jgi:hypothetical protein